MGGAAKVVIVRAKPDGINREDQFLAGIVSIGWPTNTSLESKDRKAIEAILENAFPDLSAISITQVCIFTKLSPGSIILTPSYKSRDIHIFRAISSYTFKSEWISEGNPHTVKVEHIKTVKRSEFSEIVNRALTAARKTVTNFDKYSKEILETLGNGKKPDVEKHPSLQCDTETIAAAHQALKELLKSDNEEIRLKAALALLGKD